MKSIWATRKVKMRGLQLLSNPAGPSLFWTIDRDQICLKHFYFFRQKREIYCQI